MTDHVRHLLIATGFAWMLLLPRHPPEVGAPDAPHAEISTPVPVPAAAPEPLRWSVAVAESVGPSYLTYEIVQIARVLYEEYDVHSARAILTGIGKADSYAQWSYHRKGLAVDVRVWNLYPGVRQQVAESICERLRSIDPQYRVIYGPPDHTDHMHIERRHEGHELPAGGTWCPE